MTDERRGEDQNMGRRAYVDDLFFHGGSFK
jgi:hypothetical protein